MTRTLSNQAQAAKMIRQELKAAFPTVTFKVTSDSFSGGDSVDVRWTDGPTRAEVEAITGKYQYGHFDGMFDLYEYSNSRADIPQAKYVQEQRDISIAARAAMIDLFNATHAGYALRYEVKTTPAGKRFPAHTWLEIDQESNKHTGHGWQDMEIDRELAQTSLVCACGAATLPGDNFCPQCGAPLTARVLIA